MPSPDHPDSSCERRSIPPFLFSKERINKLPLPTKRTYYRDTRTKHLALLITPAGSKSFYFVRWLHGQTTFIRLENGGYPAMTPEQARAEVAKLNGEAARGIDPAALRRAVREELTLGEVFKRWLDRAKLEKRSWAQDEAVWNRYLVGWNSRKLSRLTRQAVVDWHQRTGTRHGPYAANSALRLLRAMLNWMIGRDDLQLANPAAKIKLFPEAKREAWIDSAAMPWLLAAVDADSNPDMRDFFLLCLLTGARRGNVQAMRWADLNLSEGRWTIPAIQHKTKKPLSVPLSSPAMTLLRGRYGARGSSPYVFPSHGKTGHLIEPKAAWRRILQRAGLEGLRIHDLRHTAASWLANQGTPLIVIGAALGHTQASTTNRYAHLAVDPVRQAMDRVGNAILATRNAPAEVVPLPQRRIQGEG